MRLIALVVTLLVVTILVGFFSYQQTDDLNLRGLARWISISLVVVFVLSAVFISFVVRYKKPKADISLVRTGGKGEKVNVTAGLWINTIIHEVKEISLNTMVIEVLREGADAFITLDYNRADVEAVFYLQVEPNEEDIMRAAQALGDKSMTPETIRELIEPKLEGALRSVAAESGIAELLQRRVEFAEKVEDAVGENLKQENGLKLEAVSIIRVDQTPIDTYNPDNQFDARGIRTITEITAEQAREQERIVQERNGKEIVTYVPPFSRDTPSIRPAPMSRVDQDPTTAPWCGDTSLISCCVTTTQRGAALLVSALSRWKEK